MKGENKDEDTFEFLVTLVVLPLAGAVGLAGVQTYQWLADGEWPNWSLQWAIGAPPSTSWEGIQKILNSIWETPLWCVLLLIALLIGYVGSKLGDVSERRQKQLYERQQKELIAAKDREAATRTYSQRDQDWFSPD